MERSRDRGRKFGIDISEGMVKRAIRNCPDGIFLVSDHIPYRGFAKVIDEMKRVSNSIIIMEIPDIAKKELREKHRSETGKAKYPEQLYFDKGWIKDRGFEVFDNEVSMTNHSDYGFTALYMKQL